MLFRKPKKVLPALISDEEIDFSAAVNYDSVLDWLVGLSAQDYAKVLQVGNIYRNADQEAAAALGTANEPTTFIMPAEQDSIDPAFLDIPEKKPATKPKKIQVKE